MSSRGPGVVWPRVIRQGGKLVCSKHKREVGSVTRVCFHCHVEQMERAR